MSDIKHDNRADLHLGDCLEVLKTFQDCSVDSIVTDPPYGLSFMGKKWDYDVPSVEIWAECLRVLKPGGHLLAFAGTRTQHRMAVRIEDAGFEIRDMIAWVYGSGFPKSRNLDGEWKGWGTALKPALEPITVARKPLVGTVAENVLSHETGALNIDGCRIPLGADVDLNAMQHCQTHQGKHTVTLNNPGFSTTTYKSAGRWPANLIHDRSDEVVELTGDAARFFYCAKASKADRDEGLDEFVAKFSPTMGNGIGGKEHDPKTATPKKNVHPTVKPTALMQYLCRLVTPPGGIVLDPFMGSGSTGKAAMAEGFRFIGIELSKDYLDIARCRIEAVKKQKGLFG